MELVWQALRHPDCHAGGAAQMAARQQQRTTRSYAPSESWVRGHFRCTVSPMEYTYLPTGQKILFFGTDDPGKLKSLKLPSGAVGHLLV